MLSREIDKELSATPTKCEVGAGQIVEGSPGPPTAGIRDVSGAKVCQTAWVSLVGHLM